MSNTVITAPGLSFSELRLEDRALLDAHLKKYGGNSCQHSFAAMYCTRDKYADEFALAEGWLFVHRAGLDDERFRCYLAPLGEGDLDWALRQLLADAAQYGKKLRFESVTEAFVEKLRSLPLTCFSYSEERDLSEYIYSYEKLAELPGHKQASKRTDINRFWRFYGADIRIEPLTQAQIPGVLTYQEKWLAQSVEPRNEAYLRHENKVIRRALDAFQTLECSGLVIYYGQQICGYVFGFPLSRECYDVFIEKGDRQVKDIYRILNQEIVKRCCEGYALINREEDLGAPGLRQAKVSYEPELLMKKFIVTED